jgi:hypothetical protein
LLSLTSVVLSAATVLGAITSKLVIYINSVSAMLNTAMAVSIILFFASAKDKINFLYGVISVERIWSIQEKLQYIENVILSKDPRLRTFLSEQEILSVVTTSNNKNYIEMQVRNIADKNLIAEIAKQKANQSGEQKGSVVSSLNIIVDEWGWFTLKLIAGAVITFILVGIALKANSYLNGDPIGEQQKSISALNNGHQRLSNEVAEMRATYDDKLSVIANQVEKHQKALEDLREPLELMRKTVVDQGKFIAEILEISPALNIMVNVYGLKDCVKSITSLRPEVAEQAFKTLKTYYTLSFAWATELQRRADIVGKGNIATQLPATFDPEAFAKAVGSNVSSFITK